MSSSTALVARCWRRVASERMKMRSQLRLFMRMRSPSSAPPTAPSRGIHRDDRDLAIGEVPHEAIEELIVERALARRRPCR